MLCNNNIYMAGRFNLISETEAKGIHTFVGIFALPSLIFMSLAQLDLTTVNWTFLLSILLAKSIIFFTVILITLLIGRPRNYGRAGIFAIFCTQSNDFAIGYPIIVALYKKTHPEFASYLYLMAPISLAILNPIAFILMEIGKRQNLLTELSINRTEENLTTDKNYILKTIISVIKSIFLNPIIFMTLLGIVGNLIFKHHVPCLLGQILEVMGSAFSASALFLLGLRMVGKIHKLKGATLILPGILIIVKLLFLPIVTREIISSLHAGSNASETLHLSTYGFLYGTFPSAPTVFVFATQYSVDIDLVASAMVACTFMSAPLMFVSAKMITLTNTDPSNYIKQLNDFTMDISIAGLVVGVWVIMVFVLTKKIFRIPQRVTTCLLISQLLSCIGAILWNVFEHKEGWTSYFQFMISTVGIYSSRIWTALLALTLLLLQYRGLCFILKLQPYFGVVGWGVPTLFSVLFLLFDKQNSIPYDKRNPNFIYGAPQAIVTISLLVLSFIVTVGSLILHQRHSVRYSRYLNLANDIASTFNQRNSHDDAESSSNLVDPCPNNSEDLFEHEKRNTLSTIKESTSDQSVRSTVTDIEDLGGDSFVENDDQSIPQSAMCPARFSCCDSQRSRCNTVMQYYEGESANIEYIEEEPESHDLQVLSHIVLLIFLLCSMFVGLALSVWTLIMEGMSGIYIEISFLDATLNFGQSIIVFAIFGLNTKEIFLPLLNFWTKLTFGMKKLTLPTWDDLEYDTKHVCEQFRTHHLENCRKELAKDKRWRLKVYKNVFSGKDFVNWLIEYGLARDRIEATNYGKRLVDGNVLMHINQVYHFYDRNLLYTLN
ncbi:integral membrane protein GPR155 isoform X2 [Agrilus planipennis]|uniref:Integral membrane protein GPR155 isoform X2 n=1 Tax=Agrilus planipennis TaxID=224129 RepID=A0A1W4XCD1_AGRPL|nr:integral membrane protein GPR155 isoform X2 [Agrilus planipennis]